MQKRPEAFIPPLVVSASLLVLLIIARNYEYLPLKPPGCSFKTLAGIPCFSCGGTRAFQALSHGQVATAFRFNPALISGVFAVVIWLAAVLIRKDKPSQPLSPAARRRRTQFFVIAGVLIFIANWIYLIYYLE